MDIDQAADLMRQQARVRVYDMQHSGVLAEGTILAVLQGPSIIVVTDDGERHAELLSLPIEVEHTEWRPA